jgi:protein tyrosine/serine phosphatase
LAESAGLRYIHLPMHVRRYPPPDLAPRFLALVSDPENQPVYVYCHGGRHRTGVLTAVYRMEVEGWDDQRAYAEMRQYGFYKRWCHGSLKAYVFDSYRQLKQRRHTSDRAASFE